MSAKQARSRGYIEDILECVRRIETYTAGQSEVDFLNSEITQDAVIRNIEVMGEASRYMRDAVPEAAERFPDIPFAKMTATRNLLIHDYLHVNHEVVWNVTVVDLPALRSALEAALISWPEDLN